MTKAATSSKLAAVRDIPLTILRCHHDVTKRFELSPTGELIKSQAVPVGKAAVEVYTVASALGLAKVLTEVLTPSEVPMLGHFPSDITYVVPGGQSLGLGHAHRNKEFANWSNGPQWAVLDVDRSHCATPYETPEALHAALVELAPCLQNVEMLIISSSSSGVFTTEGRQMTPYGGWHVWFRLARGTDWPDFVSWLVGRAWQFGAFRYIVSASGSLLERGIIDASVCTPERIQYSSPATIGSGLIQLRNWSEFGEEGRELSNWRRLSADDKRAIEQRKDASRQAVAASAAETRDRWLIARRDRLMASGLDKVTAVQRAESALDGHLSDEWQITLESGNTVTVAEILSDRATYDGMRCMDPLEPEYQGNALVGRIFWRKSGDKPLIHSFAHGGANYTLGGSADTLEELVRDLLFMVDSSQFISRSTGKVLPQASVNFVAAKHLGANAAVKLMAEHQGVQHVQGRMWWPGKEQVFKYNGVDYYNDCRDLSVKLPKGTRIADSSVQPWLDHVTMICGDVTEWIFDHMAHLVQRPDVKPSAHPIIGGRHGIGKDMSIYPLRAWFKKCQVLGEVASLPEILDYHDQLVHAKLVVVSECSITDLRITDRNRLQTQLKAFTVSNGPEEVLSLNAKRKDRVEQANLMGFWMFTNSARPMELEHGDRRILFHWCRAAPKPVAYFDELGAWLEANWMTCIKWLSLRDISRYNAHAPAPMTEEKRDLIAQRTFDDDSIVADILDAFAGAPAVSIQKMVLVALAMGTELSAKGMGGLVRTYKLTQGLETEEVRGQPGGKNTPTLRRTVVVMDRAKWEALGGNNEKLRWLVAQEREQGKF